MSGLEPETYGLKERRKYSIFESLPEGGRRLIVSDHRGEAEKFRHSSLARGFVIVRKSHLTLP